MSEGEKTLEGYITGGGKLKVEREGGITEVYDFNEQTDDTPPVEVRIGDKIQWIASPDIGLIAYEICYPPYKEGRFENLA